MQSAIKTDTQSSFQNKRKRQDGADIRKFLKLATHKVPTTVTVQVQPASPVLPWSQDPEAIKTLKSQILQAPKEITRWMGFGSTSSACQVLEKGITKLIVNSDSGYEDNNNGNVIKYAIIKNLARGHVHLPTAMRFFIWYHASNHSKNVIQVINRKGKNVCKVQLNVELHKDPQYTRKTDQFVFNKVA